jgi:beta-N-acetylhexosaminidase
MKSKILRIGILFLLLGILIFVVNFYSKVMLFGIDDKVWETSEIEEKEQVQGIGIDINYKQKLGQVFISGIDGETLTNEEKEMLEEGYLGGVILFGKNIVNEEQLKALTNEIVKTATVSGITPFISIDQEGGQVSRINWIESTAQKDISDKNQSYQIALTRGEQLRDLGFNVNFAPVADFNYLKESFILKEDRAFIYNEEELVVAMVEGYRQSGIIPVVKHFPFVLGKTTDDPHDDLPQIDIEREEFEEILTRGRKVLDVDLVMASHVVMPKIDVKPVSLSEKILTLILKEGLGYEGLVVIDDVLMGAVRENYDLSEYCKSSLEAGGDVIIVSEFGEYKGIWEKLSKKDDLVVKLDSIVERVMGVKKELGN